MSESVGVFLINFHKALQNGRGKGSGGVVRIKSLKRETREVAQHCVPGAKTFKEESHHCFKEHKGY